MLECKSLLHNTTQKTFTKLFYSKLTQWEFVQCSQQTTNK